jgi:AraC-like DNA-binding protein
MQNLTEGYKLHAHDYLEIVVIYGGSADHHINDQTYRVGTGDVFVIHGETQHGFSQATTDFHVCNIFYPHDSAWVPHDRLSTLPGYQALFVLEPFRRQGQDFPSRLRLDPLALHDLMALAQRLRDELNRRVQGYLYMAQGYLLQLIVTLSRLYAGLHDEQAIGLLRLSDAVIYLEEHFREPVKIGELAARAAMSERHFSRLFRQTFQMAPSERLLELRIGHACHLLLDRQMNVTEVAYACGFRDSNYFTRQFQRQVGCTPRAYRHGISPLSQGDDRTILKRGDT